MIEIRNLGMSYTLEQGRLDVLDGVDLEIADGDTLAIIGPSGSGKTTLLLLLAGLEQAQRGSIRIDGVDLAALDADGLADLRRDRLGIVFQSFHLVPSLTALGNVSLPLEIAEQEGAGERAAAMLERVGLAERQHHYPMQLSGGEQQRVAIARALVNSPAVLLADEPTGNLDRQNAARMLDLMLELNRELQTALVVVTHDLEIAARMQYRWRLRDGILDAED